MAVFQNRLIASGFAAGVMLLVLLGSPGETCARTFAERAEAAKDLVVDAAEQLLTDGELDLAAIGFVDTELQRLAADIAAEGHTHDQLNGAAEIAAELADRGSWLTPAEQVMQLGLLMADVTRIADDFAAGFLSSDPEEKPVADAQTIFDTGVRNWLEFAGVTRSVSEGAVFSGWDPDATIVLVSRGSEIMLSIANGNYTAEWLLPVPYSRSVSFGIDRKNEELILLSVHAPDASTHFLIDQGGAGKFFVHRK